MTFAAPIVADLPDAAALAPRFDRAAIMADAWADLHDFGPRPDEMRARFADALRGAWGRARRAEDERIRHVVLDAVPCREAERLHAFAGRCALGGPEDRAAADEARAAARAAIAAHVEDVRAASREAEAERARLRAHRRAAILAALPLRPVVTFVKRDGTLRRMTLAPIPPLPDAPGAEAPERTSRPARRRVGHPHLLTVWDAEHAGFRTVNLDALRSFAVPMGDASDAPDRDAQRVA